MQYYISRYVDLDFASAVARVREELPNEGFGVLTEIDVTATIKQKLDAEFRPYIILGACNPPLAKRALELEDKLGVLLPCNVIVQQHADGRVEVAAMDPGLMSAMVDNVELFEVAQDVRGRLVRVVEAV
jgi:uncharacterized protein (DUF302 family)